MLPVARIDPIGDGIDRIQDRTGVTNNASMP